MDSNRRRHWLCPPQRHHRQKEAQHLLITKETVHEKTHPNPRQQQADHRTHPSDFHQKDIYLSTTLAKDGR